MLREKGGGLTSSAAAARRGAPKNPAAAGRHCATTRGAPAATQNRRTARAPPPVRSTAARSHLVEHAPARGPAGAPPRSQSSPAPTASGGAAALSGEKGGVIRKEMKLGFPEEPAAPGFDQPGGDPEPSDRIRRLAAFGGRTGQKRPKRGATPGRFRGPGPGCGLGARRGACARMGRGPNVPLGHMNSIESRFSFIFSKVFLI